MSKEKLKEALDQLPSGLDEYLDIPIPTLDSFSAPSTVDEAIIAQGTLAYNINEILRTFEGLHLLKLFMHIAQHNESLQLMAGTTLQYLWAGLDYIIIEPVEGVSYAPGDNSVSVQISEGIDQVTNVSCTYYIDGSSGGVLEMPQDDSDPSLYINDITFVEGEYEFMFIVNFNEQPRAKKMTITVEAAT